MANYKAEDLRKTGVYAITNSVNGKRYIGSAALSFSSRWAKHRHRLRKGTHENKYLQAAWNKYGEDSFLFEVLVRCDPVECISKEQEQIESYDTLNEASGYNLAPAAGSMLGYKFDPAVVERMAAKKRGRPLTTEALAAVRAAAKLRVGYKHSGESRAKMSASAKAAYTPERGALQSAINKARSPELLAEIRRRSKTPEARARHVAALKKVVLSPEMRQKITEARWAGDARERMSAAHKGKKLSPEHIAKMVTAKTGHKFTEEQRRRLSEAHKGYFPDMVHRMNMSLAMRGRKHSEEAKAKMRLAARTPEKREYQKNISRRRWALAGWIKNHLGMSPKDIDWVVAA